MSANHLDQDELPKKIAAAMALGSALEFGIHLTGNPDSIIVPLIREAALFRDVWGLIAIKVMFFAFFLWKGIRPSVLLFGAFTTLLTWSAIYSATGAFIPQLALNCLLMAIVLIPQNNKNSSRNLAVFFASTVFIIAGLQKINSSYLSGIEFESRAGFAVFYLQYIGELPRWVSREILPIASIILELTIGIGLLVRPKLFSHIAVLFIIALMFMHPVLSLPYFTIAACCCLIDPNFPNFLQKLSGRVPLDSPYIWLLLGLIFQSARKIEMHLALKLPALSLILAIAMLVIHILYLRESRSIRGWLNETSALQMRLTAKREKSAQLGTLLLSLMWMLPIFYHFGAPAPVGFSMFSGQTTRFNQSRALSMPSLKIFDSRVCEVLNRRLVRTVVVDVSFLQTKHGCLLIAPTDSGLRYIKERICEKSPESCSQVHLENRER